MHFKGLLSIAPLVFVISYISYSIMWGSHGWNNYYNLKRNINKEQAHIDHLFKTIQHLKNSIKNYEQDPFFIEKIARCDLSLGYTNELVYLSPPSKKNKTTS